MRPITVLVADDEALVREVLVDALAEHPLVVVVGVAGDAGEAVWRARELRPDVAIVDVRMPGGGGSEAARGIRVQSPGTRIIAHSGFDDLATSNAMLAAGAHEYIVKGSSIDRLLRSVLGAADGHVA
jgi:two-component system, NarL family, invasion response regulator UvrY